VNGAKTKCILNRFGKAKVTEIGQVKRDQAYELAAVAYTRAADAFELATTAYRAAVIAYDLSALDDEGSQFDPPETEPDK
jgi:hypothetical protein